MKILIAGFPYVRENYLKTFFLDNEHPADDGMLFLLPARWPIKQGAFIYTPPQWKGVHITSTFFHHSHYPVIGGLLKGWMPFFPLFLFRHRRKVDLVYWCGEPTLLSTLYVALWSRLMRKRLVLFSWENVPYEQKLKGVHLAIKQLLLRVHGLLAHGIVCGNEKSERIHAPFFKHTAIIPMSGVDDAFFAPSRDEGHADVCTFTFIGAIGVRKGLLYLLDALSEVLRRHTNVRFILAGSGEEESVIQNAIVERGLEAYVERIPWTSRESVRDILNRSDVFVYPSIPYGGWEEQFGYSMAEASLMELPVIATHSGSMSEVVRDGETGLLVPPQDSDALMDAMVRMAQDAAQRKRFGVAGRAFIKAHYAYTEVRRRFFQFFVSLLP
ncbi:MAG: glycosyltransferase [Candidatus Paceibacterota bacterium]|nr:MAG: glycosyltransferase [Candidatus Paceibacterota bacterium]